MISAIHERSELSGLVDGEPLLRLDGLTKRYPGQTDYALSGLSLSVHGGEIIGLLGPNGSGKTTALNCIAGLIDPTDGTINISNGSAHGTSCLGFVPDGLPLPDLLTGREFLKLVASLETTELIDPVLAARALGVEDALDRLIREYSHGMTKRLELAAAILSRPTLLMLDEPFSGLDPSIAIDLKAMIKAWAEAGRGVLISTHDLLLAERYCDRIVVVSQGRTIVSGSPADLIQEAGAEDLEGAFGHFTNSELALGRGALVNLVESP